MILLVLWVIEQQNTLRFANFHARRKYDACKKKNILSDTEKTVVENPLINLSTLNLNLSTLNLNLLKLSQDASREKV